MYYPDQTPYPDGAYFYVQQPHSYLPNPNRNMYSHTPESYYCYAPGVDPFAYSSSYTPVPPGGYEGQTAIYHDPNAASQNWIVKEAAPVTYSTSMKSSSETAVATPSSNPQLSSNQISVPLAYMSAPSYNPLPSGYQTNPTVVNNVQKRVQNPTNVSQVVRCELCNINCNSLDVYQKHLYGKKHKNNLQTRYASSSISSSLISQPINVHPGHMGITSGGHGLMGVPSIPIGKELDKKKQKSVKVGASQDSVRVCAICNVACNSEVAFADHISGKKHIAQAATVAASVGMPSVAVNPNPMSKPHVKPTQKKDPKDIKPAQSAWCEVCKIRCNNTEVLNIHRMGKKHLKNVEKLQRLRREHNSKGEPPDATVSTDPLTSGPMENAETSKDVSAVSKTPKRKKMALAPEGLKVKKQKMIHDGAAANAIRTCTVCNIVCNSESVYNSHVSGKKHAAMVLEQAKAKAKADGVQLLSAAI